MPLRPPVRRSCHLTASVKIDRCAAYRNNRNPERLHQLQNAQVPTSRIVRPSLHGLRPGSKKGSIIIHERASTSPSARQPLTPHPIMETLGPYSILFNQSDTNRGVATAGTALSISLTPGMLQGWVYCVKRMRLGPRAEEANAQARVQWQNSVSSTQYALWTILWQTLIILTDVSKEKIPGETSQGRIQRVWRHRCAEGRRSGSSDIRIIIIRVGIGCRRLSRNSPE
jgi:hypothetical protein